MDIKTALQYLSAHNKVQRFDLPAMIGVSEQTLKNWEKGLSHPQKRYRSVIERLVNEYVPGNVVIDLTTVDNRPVAYSFFSGAGGFHLGIEWGGFRVAVATDIEPTSEQTHKCNWPELPFILKDIRKISPEELTASAKGKKPELIFGGPPCQGFSTIGSKCSADPRNQLFDAYAKLVNSLSPKCVLIENVKSMVTMYKGQYAEYIIKTFSELGYRVYRKILNAADYGIPQNRYRVFFFCTKLKHPFAFPKPTHGPENGYKPYETVGKHIMDLISKGDEINGHIVLNHSEKVLKRYRLIPEGGRLPSPHELPAEIRRKNFGNTYKRLHSDSPSLTLVPGNNAFPVHPTLDRSLTPREAARLQSFPDSFSFIGDRRRQCILVGNAVPPVLGKVLGQSIISHMNNNTLKTDDEFCGETVDAPAKSLSAQEKIMPKTILHKNDSEDGFIDLFCGAGGFTVGLSRANWNPLLCVDNNRNVKLTHEHNYPSIPFMDGDLSDEELKKAIVDRFKGKKVGLIVGGPPCQGFSIFGKRRFVNTKGYYPHDDPRNKLVFSFIELVSKIKPRWFVMENVTGFTNLDKGWFLQTVIEEFKNAGYANTEFNILNSAYYGVPQLRKRLVIIGNLTGHVIPWPKKKFFPEPKDWQSPYRTVGEVISDLANGDSYSKHTCHVPMKHKPLLVERYKYIPEGGRLEVKELPDHLKTGYRTKNVRNYSHIFKRLHRDKPSLTMVPGHNAFPIHPWLNRALTVREAARIQTFPDEIEFKGNRQEQCIQVGNAFPPLLAELIGNNIKKAEVNRWFPGKVPASATYALIETHSQQLELFN